MDPSRATWLVPYQKGITTIRGKAQLQHTLKIVNDHMTLIDEEITASNARKFGKNFIARVHFSKQYTQQWYTEERANKFSYQQHVDDVTTEKMRQSYTFCNVQAGRRTILPTPNMTTTHGQPHPQGTTTTP